MSKAATTEELAAIHRSIAETIVEDLGIQVPKLEADDDLETKKLKLALMDTAYKLRHDARAHAITFLKNNNITAGKGNAELAALEEALRKQKANRQGGSAISARALEEAAELAATRLQ